MKTHSLAVWHRFLRKPADDGIRFGLWMAVAILLVAFGLHILTVVRGEQEFFLSRPFFGIFPSLVVGGFLLYYTRKEK